MRSIKIKLISGIILSLFILSAQPAYSRDYYDHHEHHRGRMPSYRYHRYYPKKYYYRRKISGPRRRHHYYFFDLFPDFIYYYGGEENHINNNPDYLSITSIANMAAQGVPSSVIISEIARTHSKYELDISTINYLRQNGVSNEVIDYMLNTSQ